MDGIYFQKKKDAAQYVVPTARMPVPAFSHNAGKLPLLVDGPHLLFPSTSQNTGRETQYQPCVSEKPDKTPDGLLLHDGRKTKIEAAVAFCNRYPFGMACK